MSSTSPICPASPAVLGAGLAVIVAALSTAFFFSPISPSSSNSSSSSSSSVSSLPAPPPIFSVSGQWFGGVNPNESSAASNSCLEEWKSYVGPSVYSSSAARDSTGLPYVDIVDNTEGISGVADLYIPSDATLVVDVGGGKSDAAKLWSESRTPSLTYLVADPFGRSPSHNASVQSLVESRGGADVVLSISVLNVIRDDGIRSRHVAVVHKAVKVGGVAYFKVWAGVWPSRGTGVGTYNKEMDVYQANRWCGGFKEEVGAYFGIENVIVDYSRNLLTAIKKR